MERTYRPEAEIRCIGGACDGTQAFHAFVDEQKIGYVIVCVTGDRMQLCDIQVDENARTKRMSFIDRLMRHLFPREPQNLRCKGIGTQLLQRALAEADARRVREVWGCVTQRDLEKTPTLLGWYQKRGFTVSQPDEECRRDGVKDAIHKVSLKSPCISTPPVLS